MNKYQLWRQFLIQQQRTAFNLFVIAGVALLGWRLAVRGKTWEKWANLGAVCAFLGLAALWWRFCR